ncbi:flagellar motor switch protein FliG [Clostridium sp. MSJ-8]|uniref:flagellar motor switch protein FliG n=1 Tax=Clostridium sp. MSJ-8 TaxID=2841510 RepID=UPI001C0ED5BB|nr:flagellar motor switch protein FliG [Clostridium sp. MSJ-8]MBU5488401.1 flagellar motor switch protein FliG [Clostridium sp. MSJ-8]
MSKEGANSTAKLTGTQKAAVLFITLGPEASSGILKRLPEAEIQKITYEIANITSVNSEVRQAILDEFLQINKARDYILEGGMDYAKALLSKALGNQRAMEILEKVSEAQQQYRPFAIARKAEASQLLNVISYENPQTIALVLCYVQPDKAAQVMAELPEEVQSEVAFRIATMDTTSPMVIKEIEKVLESKLSSVVRTETTTIGGVQSLVDILNQVDRTTEKNITESLEREDAELADKVKSSMFVFEDIITLDDISIQRILREVEAKELALALKGCSEEVAEAIYRNQSKRAAASLKEDMEFLGPVRLMDVEKSQQKIVSIIRRLDEAGEIIISRGGEDALIV